MIRVVVEKSENLTHILIHSKATYYAMISSFVLHQTLERGTDADCETACGAPCAQYKINFSETIY